MAIQTVRLTDRWATRRLMICFRALEELSPLARDLMEYLSPAAQTRPGPDEWRASPQLETQIAQRPPHAVAQRHGVPHAVEALLRPVARWTRIVPPRSAARAYSRAACGAGTRAPSGGSGWSPGRGFTRRMMPPEGPQPPGAAHGGLKGLAGIDSGDYRRELPPTHRSGHTTSYASFGQLNKDARMSSHPDHHHRPAAIRRRRSLLRS